MCGVHFQLFVGPVGDDALGAEGGDVAVDGGHERGCVILWEGLICVWVFSLSPTVLKDRLNPTPLFPSLPLGQ